MIEIELKLEDLPSLINADPGQIEQVIMNLAVNARDAMPEGGKLTIGTESVTLGEQYCRLHSEATAGTYVLLTISDTGTGMEKETLEHMFDPFFTTKEVGRGTGLGLAVVYGIVRQHGGHVSCDTEPGQGTTFNVYFPAAKPLDGFSNGEVGRLIIKGGTETVLLVDDEDFILELGQQILRQSGYKVLTARTGKEALHIYRQQPGAISLVLLDFIMPEMSGKQCMLELLKLDPKAKILMSSGYAADGASNEAFDLGARGFVSKPFDVARFLHQVRSTLDAP
jgi:two-component system cell cycle sensor histidine kinase/response regulator CckA